MAEQRMKDYRRIMESLQHCENMLENFRRSFAATKLAKEEIFDDAERRAAFIELVQLDTDTTLTDLQTTYQKYKDISDWLEANA